MLDVKRLRMLREVAEAGSFSAAADSLHLTQSAVSQQIAALEREAGAILVDRNRGNLRLTDPGQALIDAYNASVIPEDRDTERTLLLKERMQLALPKDHRLATRKTVSLSDLAEETWIIGTEAGGGACRGNVFGACRDAG